MGDTSIIARRLSERYVQYGWGGNGGVYFPMGEILLEYYEDPDTVEYLFGLGQLSHLWEPHSEKTGSVFSNRPTGQPHWVGRSEREIFSQIAFTDVGYFYDSDRTWYYIVPGPFRIKLPLSLVGANLDKDRREFIFLDGVELEVLNKVAQMCRTDPTIGERLAEKGLAPNMLDPVLEELKRERWLLHAFWKKHRKVFDCFDDWVLVNADESGKNVGEIILRPKEETHIETINWKTR